ncbi:ATP-binding protein [Streptomyces sp. NPDC006365]|uniref:ATP-binding protein n=1 Tax=Streptomyces sp. NPDC006365 TaxID=3364744 RepID=UPI0036771333
MDCIAGLLRKPWDLSFVAEPEEIAGLRRIMRLHLGLWGLHEVIDAAQLCVSELASNVITHVGVGTPTTLAVSMSGARLRIEVHDPDTRALPTLVHAGSDSENGRGMALVDATADHWGVQLRADRKVTWCELETGLASANGHCGGTRVTRVEAMLRLYGNGRTKLPQAARSHALTATVAEVAAIAMIADLLHWLRAHGCDADEALDRAQIHFEAEIAEGHGHSA